MRQLWTQRGTTAAVALSIENGDAPIKNWRGVGSRDFPMNGKSLKIDGKVVDKYITKKLSCGDCPAPCKGIVAVKGRGLSDVRRPDYETIVGFGANLLNDDLELVISHVGTRIGHPNFDARADVNGDGVIDAADISAELYLLRTEASRY